MDTKIAIWLLVSVLLSVTMDSESSKVVEGNKLFSAKMHKILARESGNVISSPFSAHVVLSMAHQGAHGSTYEDFSKVLGVPDASAAAEEYHTLLAKLNSIENVTLNIANKICIMEKFSLKPAFKDVVLNKYYSEAEEMNFAATEESAKKINDWVEDKTNKKIKDLIKADDLSSDTRCVLLNAIYFKGNWAKKFKPEHTKKETFHLLDGKDTQVDMMHLNGKFRYSENQNLNAKILELPYEGHDVSMMIILPNERNGITELETKISEIDYAQLSKEMRTWEVDVALPKFKIESEIKMNDMLTEMGLGVIFTDAADFSNIANVPLKVSKVIQKAFIEVNEEGAEAAAATGFGIMAISAPIYTPVIADHPFIVVIREAIHGNVLFVAHVYQPDAHI